MVLGQAMDGEPAGPPAPPAPPLSGVVPQTAKEIQRDAAIRKKTASQVVPTIQFKAANDSQAVAVLNDQDTNVENAHRAADDQRAASRSRKSAEPEQDPLVELTAQMVEDADNADVTSPAHDDLAPAEITTMDQCCCPPCNPLIWVGGVEASFLWPDANSDAASFEFEDDFADLDVSHSSEWDGVDTMVLTPRIWLGVQGCAWGTNVRYWHLRACGGVSDPTLEDDADEWGHSDFDWDKTPDTGFFSYSSLEAYTIDWELTRRFCLGNCASQASLGVRYGSIELRDSVTGLAVDDEARHIGYARSDAYSRGTGVVFGLYGRKPLFPCSCVHWFYSTRLSALWGPTCTSAETFAAVMADESSAGSVNGASTYVDDAMFVGEVQLGLEWNYALQCLPANAFFRTAVEYQRWDGGDGSSEAGSFATFSDSDYSSTSTMATSAASPQLDLVGLTIGTGLTW